MNQRHDHFPEGASFRSALDTRYRIASIWQVLFFSALLIAIISLTALLYKVIDDAFGYVAYEYKNDPAQFTSTPLAELNKDELIIILKDNLSS